jgi:glycosyltransferase involved in cell wall biosynthesis
MNWKALEQVRFNGRTYGMKDLQFARFDDLPRRVDVPLEVAVEGRGVPVARLETSGWRVVAALDVASTYADYHRYIENSLAEFSVVKDVYCGLNVGWFSDRSAAYLAHGRPVIVQDNGLSGHVPTGEGLFEVGDVDEAADAVERVVREPERHSRAARRIAEEYFDTGTVLGRFLDEIGIPSKRAVRNP